MNIVYLTQITNLQISDKNPMDYYYDCQEFENVLCSHLLRSRRFQPGQELKLLLKYGQGNPPGAGKTSSSVLVLDFQ
ncbi:hypothetical protein M1N04_00590 [Peptococcaceae bacterium]|nr:hypothetical protein [Peptococcaceae bacterium]